VTTVDPGLVRLTDQQVVAAATPLTRVFLEASPGSGKTTVAAQRFGAQRYNPSLTTLGLIDDRSVTALSFTRSATWELHRRVRRTWGPAALRWPHRIVTLDTLLYDLLVHLLDTGQVRWPGGHRRLEVYDSWKVLADETWRYVEVGLRLRGPDVQVVRTWVLKGASRVSPIDYEAAIAAGKCTHEDVRDVLDQALADQDAADALVARLAATTRALIVDEVFDANALDIAVLDLAARAGVAITAIGDPWQALYGFRGAKPDAIPGLVARTGMAHLPLSQSFRWRSDEQRLLADGLRGGASVTLPADPNNGRGSVDVVLACWWQHLWDVGPHVLPLAHGSAKGNPPEAAATLLLNHLTRIVFNEDATYLADALTTLRITDPETPRHLEAELQDVLDMLRTPGKPALIAAYNQLVQTVRTVSSRGFPAPRANYTKRLDVLRNRLAYDGELIPGMTTHQAKGREWSRVGVRLREADAHRLDAGLTHSEESDRQLYVACTRARMRTVAV
jgi:DNA helicase-2/ATP-dependent DNA helicase PcrA